MNTRTTMCGLLLAVFALAGSAQAQNVYFEATGLYWKRNTNRKDFDYFEGPEQVDPAQNLAYEWENGARARLAYDNYNWEIEGVATFLEETHASHRAGALGLVNLDMAAPIDHLAFVNSLQQAAAFHNAGGPSNALDTLAGGLIDARANSSYYDVELNLNGLMPNATWLKIGAGARYGNLDETFNLSIDDTTLTVGGGGAFTVADLTGAMAGPALNNKSIVSAGLTGAAPIPTGSVLDLDWDADVSNELIGPQMTVHGIFYENDRVMFEAGAKWGVFLNHITSMLTERISTGASAPHLPDSVHGTRTYVDDKDRVAVVGNASVAGTYKLRETIRLKVGYEVMMLSGVALASDQWQHVQADAYGRSTYELDAATTVFWHGGTGSVEIIW